MSRELRVRSAAAEDQQFRTFLTEGQAGQELFAFEPFGLFGPWLDAGE